MATLYSPLSGKPYEWTRLMPDSLKQCLRKHKAATLS
jgi:hypothetical protein